MRPESCQTADLHLHQYSSRASPSLSTPGPPCSLRKMEMAFILLWLFLLVAWSAILIGLVFTFRVNHHHCEMCGSTTLCRDTTPAWGETPIEECLELDEDNFA